MEADATSMEDKKKIVQTSPADSSLLDRAAATAVVWKRILTWRVVLVDGRVS